MLAAPVILEEKAFHKQLVGGGDHHVYLRARTQCGELLSSPRKTCTAVMGSLRLLMCACPQVATAVVEPYHIVLFAQSLLDYADVT